MLLSAQGMDVPAIAKVAFTSEDRVRDVIRNFNADGFGSLYPKYKGGRPPDFTLPQRRERTIGERFWLQRARLTPRTTSSSDKPLPDHHPVRAENLVRGCHQQGCPPGRPAVMITDHVPAVRLPPDYAGHRVAASVPA